MLQSVAMFESFTNHLVKPQTFINKRFAVFLFCGCTIFARWWNSDWIKIPILYYYCPLNILAKYYKRADTCNKCQP